MRIKMAIPDHLVEPGILEAALEATTLANQGAIEQGGIPEIEDAIAQGVRWKPEPFTDGEHFDLAETVAERGWGDCDDLAPWLAASMRASGEDPDARPRVYQSGPNRWHVVVQSSDGQILDPSRWAGMDSYKKSKGGIVGVGPAIARPFARPGDGALAVMPYGNGYAARCDIPWPETYQHLASLARARDPELAIQRAIQGAVDCGVVIGADVDEACLAGTLLLGDEQDLVDVGFLPALAALAPAGISLAKGLFGKKKKRPSAPPPGSQQHPGGAVSVPVRHAKRKGSGGQHMMLTYHPAGAPGPVVMRF